MYVCMYCMYDAIAEYFRADKSRIYAAKFEMSSKKNNLISVGILKINVISAIKNRRKI